MVGELDAAEPIYGDVVAIARELRDREIVAIGLLNLAMVSIGPRLDGACAQACCSKCSAIAEEIGSKPVAQSVFEVVRRSRGGPARNGPNAGRFYGTAEAQARETGLRRDPTDEAFLSPFIAQARTRTGARRRSWRPRPKAPHAPTTTPLPRCAAGCSSLG